MMPARIWRLCGCVAHGAAKLTFLALCLLMGLVGASFTRDRPSPYIMLEREVLTLKVRPGEALEVMRTIRYLDEDCLLHYEYRAQSEVGKRRSVLFPDVDYDHPPMDLDEKPKTLPYPIPADMECGKAYFIESAASVCGPLRRFRPWNRRPDVRTDFEVVGCEGVTP